jgi:hypothetical protein
MHPLQEFDSAGPRGSAMAASEMTVARSENGTGQVAVVLAIAAVIAAIIGWQAATISSSAGDAWQSSLRTEVQRAASAQEDVRFMYGNELPVAVRLLEAQALEAAYRSAANDATGGTKAALLVEADTQAQVAATLIKSFDLTSTGNYVLPEGGLDLAKRLADLRAKTPDMLALDPDALQATGDALANKANLMTLALLPTSLGALFGVLAQPLRKYRRDLLALGWTGVVIGATFALGVFGEVLK